MSDIFIAEGKSGFPIFNAGAGLSMEPITGADLEAIEVAPGSPLASMAWSCNSAWYFVITDQAILLLNVYTNKGFRCNKLSAMFIEEFLQHVRL